MPASCDCVRRRRRQMSTDFAWSSISKFHVVECDRAQLRFCRNGSAPLSEAYLAAGRPYRSSGVPKKKKGPRPAFASYSNYFILTRIR